MIISVGEDASHVVARVEYDSETDCCGFCFTFGRKWSTNCQLFQSSAIENMFSDNQIAKYVYIYMAQPLRKDVPDFCLACISTNKKFTYETVLNHYNYIFEQCKRRGIHVASFGGDGDSCVMKTMRIASGLLLPKEGSKPAVGTVSTLKPPKIPSSWFSWYYIHLLSTLACVQDVIHVADKLKFRLIKPSVMLPMGDYVAGSHHIPIIQYIYGKDEHGYYERDVDYKDKQNYNACLHIRAARYLDTIPYAFGTNVM